MSELATCNNPSSLNQHQQKEEVQDKCKVIIEPHILRLLRLIQYPTSSKPAATCRNVPKAGEHDNGRNEYADHAARMLGQITSQSSPLVLWDILGRLRHMLLHSALWSTRQCVALAMTLVSCHLPLKDQQEFISGTAYGDDDDAFSSSLLWLTISDLTQPIIANSTASDSISLDVVLNKGTLLFSRLESSYNTLLDDEDQHQQLYTVEDSILNTLDTKAIDSATKSLSLSENTRSLFDARLQYQRSIMARRLGLAALQQEEDIATVIHNTDDTVSFAQNFVARELLTHSFLTNFITRQDIIANNNIEQLRAVAKAEEQDAKCYKRKAKRKQQPQSKKTEKNSEAVGDTGVAVSEVKTKKKKRKGTPQHQQESNNDEDYGTVRALLVLEMRSDASTNGMILSSKSHSRPRTLLATDLLFSMFHPDWQTRHGACLGILALCKAWLPSVYHKSKAYLVFGSWLQDILARSVCVLALDRFGDYSDDDKEGGVVAPVRLAAAQLLAFLWNVAPHDTQVQTLRLLRRMIVVSECSWEVRHGSMLALFYICSASSSIPKFLEGNNYFSNNNNLNNCNGVSLGSVTPNLDDTTITSVGGSLDILFIASHGLTDDSDDVRSVSSRVVLQLLHSSAGHEEGSHRNPAWCEKIISACTPFLWKALQEVRSVSSCVADLLFLLEGAITVNAHSVVRNILHSKLDNMGTFLTETDVAVTNNINKGAASTVAVQDKFSSTSDVFDVICQVLAKLIEFLDYEYISCQISSLNVLAKVMEPIYLLTNSLIQTSNLCNGEQGEEREKYSSVILTLVSITCHLLIKIYNSLWETSCHADSDPKYQKKYQDALDRCWCSLVGAVAMCASNQHFVHLSSFTEMINKMYATVFLSYFGILLIDPQPSPSHDSIGFGGESRPMLALLSKEKNHIQRRDFVEDEIAYEHQLAGAIALNQLSAKLFETHSSNEKGIDVKMIPKNIFHLFLQVMLESPWQDLAESGILLYTATANKSRRHPTMLNFLNEHDKFMGSKIEKFINLLHQDLPYCIYLRQNYPNGETLLNCNTTRTEFCDKTLVAALQSLMFYKVYNESDSSNLQVIVKVARGVVDVWKRLFVCNLERMPATKVPFSSATTLSLMRMHSEISSAVISRGINYTPTETNLIIKSLMTSLQHEQSRPRHNASSLSLADLVLRLSSSDLCCTGIADVELMHQRKSTCKQVFTRVCSLIYSNIPSLTKEVTEVHSEHANAAESVISRLISGIQSSGSSVLSLLQSELDTLICAEDGYAVGENVKQKLYLFKIISESIYESPSAMEVLTVKLLYPVSLIACNSPSTFFRQLATVSVKNSCVANSSLCMPIIIPVIFDSLRDLDDDARRFGGIRLLHCVTESLGIQICPFIKCVLPAVMSTLNDPVDDCARTAASTFAALVRAAPLVVDEQKCVVSDSKNDISGAPFSLTGGKRDGLPTFFARDDESSGKVIDHLIHGKPFPTYFLPSEVTAAMKAVQLRGYQMEGVSWIRFLASVNLNGVLADDMGLGKTLQTLVAIGVSYCSNGEKEVLPTLVVCPSTVVGHWVGEIQRFFTNDLFKTWSYAGSAKKRRENYETKLSDCNIVVTSYAVLRNDVEWLSSKRWNYVVLDEGHLLKNPKTATAKAVRTLQCKRKLLLSGTPVQNRCQEIWAIFDFLMPNFLGTESRFFKHFAKPIVDGQLPGASADEVGKSVDRLKQLHQQVLPFILRREKSQVLKELPEKVVTNILCELSHEQLLLYKMISSKLQTKIANEHLKTGANGCPNPSNDILQNDQCSALKSLLLLRLLCTHPKLVVSSMYRREDCGARNVKKRERISGAKTDVFSAKKLDRLMCSGKLVALNDLLRSAGVYRGDIMGADNDVSCLYVEDDDKYCLADASFLQCNVDDEPGKYFDDCESRKCLIFAQFSRSLDIVEECLFAPHMPSLRYLRLDGNVSLDRRTEMVDQFNSDKSIRVMLLTTKVGGLGLNLSAAQLVILLENDWNPYADLQAIDRAHRIGQQGTLQVYRLITRGTVEEQIMKLQDQKMAMSEAIVNTDNSSVFSMGTDRLLDLFTFQSTESDDEVSELSTHHSLEDYELAEGWLDEE